MREDPSDLVDMVVDEVSFLRFLTALKNDWCGEQSKERVQPSSPCGPGANGWVNGTIGEFLEAALAWAGAMSAERRAEMSGTRAAQENAWRRIANMLIAGKFYE